MNRRPFVIASACVLALALTGCTAPPSPGARADDAQAASRDDATSAATSQVTPMPSPTLSSCDRSGWVHVGMSSPEVTKTIVDQGARELAAGTVGRDAEGRIVTYTVAAGDAPYAIGARLCLRGATGLAELNHTRTIHPGQVLRIYLDPDVPRVPYFSPDEAPAGFQQIPYQRAIEAMGIAADAGDVATMRRIWTDTLSAMFTDPANRERIGQEVENGDLEVLRQMFS